jgi:hypothetical protein
VRHAGKPATAFGTLSLPNSPANGFAMRGKKFLAKTR